MTDLLLVPTQSFRLLESIFRVDLTARLRNAVVVSRVYHEVFVGRKTRLFEPRVDSCTSHG
jgi:hypothetical protein